MCLRRSSRSLCQVYKREILSDFTKKVAGSNGLIGNPHINKTDTTRDAFRLSNFIGGIRSSQRADRIPAGCEQRETQMKTSFPEHELAAPLLRTLSQVADVPSRSICSDSW